MLRKPHVDAVTKDRVNSILDKMIGKIYFFFICGVISEIINIKPTKIAIAGTEFGFDAPLELSYLFYVVVILYYVGMFGMMFLFNLYPGSSDLVLLLRNSIYTSLGKRKTLIRRSARDIKHVKLIAKTSFTVFAIVVLIYIFFPFVYIIYMRGWNLLQFIGMKF